LQNEIKGLACPFLTQVRTNKRARSEFGTKPESVRAPVHCKWRQKDLVLILRKPAMGLTRRFQPVLSVGRTVDRNNSLLVRSDTQTNFTPAFVDIQTNYSASPKDGVFRVNTTTNTNKPFLRN
jgi:hypothetical protein